MAKSVGETLNTVGNLAVWAGVGFLAYKLYQANPMGIFSSSSSTPIDNSVVTSAGTTSFETQQNLNGTKSLVPKWELGNVTIGGAVPTDILQGYQDILAKLRGDMSSTSNSAPTGTNQNSNNNSWMPTLTGIPLSSYTSGVLSPTAVSAYLKSIGSYSSDGGNVNTSGITQSGIFTNSKNVSYPTSSGIAVSSTGAAVTYKQSSTFGSSGNVGIVVPKENVVYSKALKGGKKVY